MFFLTVNFRTILNILFFALLIGANSFWFYSRFKRNSAISFVPFVFINIALFLAHAWSIGIDSDECEHLHCAWLVSQGLIPFKDFWQHHSPFLWVILSPVFRIAKPAASIFDLSRIAAVSISLVSGLLGWRIARLCWQGKASLPLYAFLLSGLAVFGQFWIMRPDLFMQFFLLAGIYFTLRFTEKRIWMVLLAGVSFGLGLSFILKQYLLLFLPVIAICMHPEAGKPRQAMGIFLYSLGVAAGLFPLGYYLGVGHIISDFMAWVLVFNAKRIVFTSFFLVPAVIMGGWGAYRAARCYSLSGDRKAFIICAAFILCSFSSLTGVKPMLPSSTYYLGLWYFISSVLGSGVPFLDFIRGLKSAVKQAIILGLFVCVFVFPVVMSVVPQKKEKSFADHKKIVSQLLAYCRYDSCFTLVPFHPVFSFDATRLFLIWQRHFGGAFSSVKKDLKRHDIAKQIFDKKPAVIVYRIETRLTTIDLLLNGWISKDDYKQLLAFLEKEYTVKDIGDEQFYIRNDKL